MPRSAALVFFVLGFLAGVVASADTTKQSNGSEEAEIDLYELTDAELEDICVSRGFELVREIDDATGEPISYTHDDYVDAAKECLELEAEMETFFQENPDLIDDLKAETDAMMKEKEELEQRLAEAQDKLVKEKTKQEEKVKRKAFMNPENSDKDGSNEHLNSLPYGDDTSSGRASTADASSADDSGNDEGKRTGKTVTEGQGSDDDEDATEEEDVIDLDKTDSSAGGSKSKSTSQDQLDSESEETGTFDSKKVDSAGESGLGIASDSEDKGPLAFSRLTKETILEFRDKVQKDLDRIGQIIIPEPLREPLKEMVGVSTRVAKSAAISTASIMKRYFIAILDSVKEVRAADGEDESDENPSILKKYLSALLSAVRKARAGASSEEENIEDANVR